MIMFRPFFDYEHKSNLERELQQRLNVALESSKEKTKDLEWDLPYLDKSKLKAFVEGNFLKIEYFNKEDKRRSVFTHSIYVGDCNFELQYTDDGYLKLNFKSKPSEKKEVKIN